MPISREEWKEEYLARARASADKLVKRYTARRDKLARMTSEEAQRNYEEAMRDPSVLRRRLVKLKQLSEEDLNRAMERKGAIAYTAGVEAAADKAAERVAPYLEELDRLIATLPPRTRDPMQNLTRRAGHIVKGLSELKKRLEGV